MIYRLNIITKIAINKTKIKISKIKLYNNRSCRVRTSSCRNPSRPSLSNGLLIGSKKIKTRNSIRSWV